MTPDELASPPRKAEWKRWAIALACVVAAATFALLASAPKPEPVKVWFVRATNEAGVKKLVFEGTNGLPREIPLGAGVCAGSVPRVLPAPGAFSFQSWTTFNAPAATNFFLTLNMPASNVSYYVMWGFLDNKSFTSRCGKFRSRCSAFFSTHGMPRLAMRFLPRPEMHIIPSTEIKE